MIDFKVILRDTSRRVIDDSAARFQDAAQYRYTDFNKYLKILNQLYGDESRRRVEILRHVQNNPQAQAITLSHICKRENIIDFMVDWCWTYDPRNANIGLPASVPWIPWQRQIDFIEWFYNHYLNQQGGMVEKSRDQGATWLFCLIFLQEWRWVKGFAGGIGSNKLDNVDKRDNPDCIFEKMRTLMHHLPKWWFPNNWNDNSDKIANLTNPENKANISGQGGKDIGRGGRRSVYMVDESASLEFPQSADAALSQNTNSQFDLSTPKGMNHFGQKRQSGRLDVFTFSWRDDPRKDINWYEKECERLDPVVVAQELDIDYYASVDGLFIEPKWVRAAIDFPLKAEGVRSAGLDVAAGGASKSALCLRTGPVARVLAYNIENAVDLVYESVDRCHEAEITYLNYDRIGVGHAVYSVANRTERQINFAHYGLEAGDSPSERFYPEFNKIGKEIFFNARAEWWYNLSIRFKKTYEFRIKSKHYPPEEMISIENNSELIAQLSSPMRMTTDTGKIKCESKDKMRSRGIKSPDEADAMVMAFCPMDGGHIHAVSEYTNISSIYSDFNILDTPSSQRQLHYGALSMKDNLETNGLCAIWNEVRGHLYVYDEINFPRPLPTMIAGELIHKMRMDQYYLEKMLGNDMMLAEGRRSMMREINDQFFKKVGQRQNIKVRPPKRYDPIGSLAILNELVSKKKITINKKCVETHRQLSTWRLEKGKLKEEGMRECLLMIVSELKQIVPFSEILKTMEYVTHIKEAQRT